MTPSYAAVLDRCERLKRERDALLQERVAARAALLLMSGVLSEALDEIANEYGHPSKREFPYIAGLIERGRRALGDAA